MAAVWQQVLALDAKYNAYRAPNSPHFRTLYIRRRSQLLRETAKVGDRDPNVRRDYLRLRSQLLTARYGSPAFSDQSSLRSRALSLRSLSRNTVEVSSSLDSGGPVSRKQWHQLKHVYDSSMKHIYDSIELVPSSVAEASSFAPIFEQPDCEERAMAGGKSVSENYAFAGMHHIFDQHAASVTSVKFANDDKSRVACSSTDGTLSICQLIPPPATVICMLRGHGSGITDFSWSSSNDIILSVSLDGTARLWDVAAGSCIRVIEDGSGAELLCCHFQPLNNNMFVTGSNRGHVQVMNVSTGQCCKGGSGKAAGRILTLAFDSNGRILWTGDDKGFIFSFLFDIATGKLAKGRRITVCENRTVTSISARSWINREARDPSLLVNCAVNYLFLFSIISEDGGLQLKRKFPIKHRTAHVKSTFCPLMSFRQGACVISGSEDMCVYFFDIAKENKSCVNKLLGHSAPVLDVCFNYDESLLASCDANGMVIIWKREGKQGTL
ncbi:WD repeat-containing protein 13 isoform X2 [Octopus sinensis]|uniref:WD repeat-containing protein 13 isoform X2 n=1 Tax=Octopus sinensis TaxID=2607531 RepID=A0A7E6FKN1_9MOLL|nr:WD repeat-containing protein 13 isoform X2 [Octopus sinensis]